MEFLQRWRFDVLSGFITIVLIPLVFFLFKIGLRHLKHWTGFVTEGLLYWVSRSIMHSLAGALTLKRYCRLYLSRCNRFLHVPSRLDIRLDIDQVYVPLILENPGGGKKAYSHTDVLTAGNRICIVGDPGSGKSSLVKRLLRDACQQAIGAPLKSRFPMMLELKNLEVPGRIRDRDLGRWFYEKLRRDAEETAAYEIGQCFDSYAETAGLLVLLDGLDEVSTKSYPRVQTAINELSSRLDRLGDRNVILLTLREQFHQQVRDAYRETFPQTMFLKAFTPSDIFEFLTRWPFESGAEDNISRIYKELTDRPSLREMCRNPLILSMYVAEDQAQGTTVTPETRTEFYSKVTEELIIRRRLQQIGPARAAAKLKEQRERILGRLAYEHILDADQPTNSLRWTTAMDVTMNVLHCNEADAEQAFRELAKETGLVTEERSRQTFRFIHLTFCEFLAAFESVQGQESGWSNLICAHQSFQAQPEPQLRSRLAEVIPFACGLLPRVRRYEALNDVVGLGNNYLTSLAFLETKLYDHPSWPTFAAGQRQSLIDRPEENWDEDWLRQLHTFNVVVRDANYCASYLPGAVQTVDLAVFFQALVEKQRSSLSTLLSAYATQDAAAAFRLAEICNLNLAADFPQVIISNCDQVPFLALVREQALREIDRLSTWASLLSEAALRSKAVARQMSGLAPSRELDITIATVPRRRRWFNGGFVSSSLYTQLLTIALASVIPLNSPLSMLQIVSSLRPPGAVRFANSYYICTTGAVLAAAGWFFWSFVNSIATSTPATRSPAVLLLRTPSLVFIATYLLWFFLALRFGQRRRGYEYVLQTGRQGPSQTRRKSVSQDGRPRVAMLLGRRSVEHLRQLELLRTSAFATDGIRTEDAQRTRRVSP